MKKPILCLVALILMLVSASALATSGDEALITDTLRQAGITEPVQLTQWGDTAACFAETDGVKRLVVLERHDGAWQIVIDNPTALIQEWDWPELYSDTDTAIYWEYKSFDGKTAMVFSNWREAGVWGQVEAQIAGNEAAGALYPLTCIGWRENHGGEMVFTHFIDDENGNTIRESVEYVPAPQLSGYSQLATYDVAKFPVFEQASALTGVYSELALVGAWQFVGGGELMGYGFRLNADGTGRWLDSEDMEHCPPKHLHETGDSFTWQLDGDSFICRNSQGTVTRYTLEQADFRILFTEEEAGGFYARFDEEAIRAEIEDRMGRGEMTEFDALVMDYLDDTLEPTLAECLNLRDVNARVDWYSEEKSVIVEAWQLDEDDAVTSRFTESDTTVSIGTSESTWFTNSGVRINPTADRYYQAARAALDQATEIQAEQQMLTGDVTPSGRELQPGEAEIMAEIEQKRADGIAEAFDNLAMDAMDGTMTARLEAMGLTEISTRVNWEGSPRFILAWGWDSETHFRVALRFTPCAIGVCVGDEVGDVTQIPVSWYENYLRNPEIEIYENAYRLIQSELALASQQQQTLFSMPGLTGYVGQFPKGKTYEVYRGPGQNYGRSANGKASVSTNDTIMVYGVRGGWMLISYGISGGHTRYGWISTSGLPASMFEYCPELIFPGDDGTDYVYATVRQNARVVDVLESDQDFIYPLQPGDSIHCLAEMNGWVLVETYAYEEPYWGFVRWDDLDTRHGYAFTMKTIEPSSVWSEEEICAAMQAVADAYTGRAAGHTLISLRYSDEDNSAENWPSDVPDGIEWMKLYGTARSISYYDFEIAGSDGTAEDLAFYVWREPGGEWVGGIGGYE